MATYIEIRDYFKEFPDVVETEDRFGFQVLVRGKWKGICWTWMERTDPKKKRVPNPQVLAIRVPNLEIKEFLLSSGNPAIFTEPHYNGYPAVLVRLAEQNFEDLSDHLLEAYNCTTATKSSKKRVT